MSLVVPIVDIFSFEFQKNILEINIRPRLASVGSIQAHFVKNMQALLGFMFGLLGLGMMVEYIRVVIFRLFSVALARGGRFGICLP
jgi:hypothetical protein